MEELINVAALVGKAIDPYHVRETSLIYPYIMHDVLYICIDAYYFCIFYGKCRRRR
jgi:hypothetical protein